MNAYRVSGQGSGPCAVLATDIRDALLVAATVVPGLEKGSITVEYVGPCFRAGTTMSSHL